MAPKNTSRTNTPTEQNKEDNSLVLYRLDKLEAKVDIIGTKLDSRENITKTDLLEFRERLFETIAVIQKELAEKADKTEVATLWAAVKDLKGLVKMVGAAFGSIIVGIVVYYLTSGSK